MTGMETGMIVGRYRLAERLAKGGMGEVWSVETPESGRQVVLKCIPSLGLSADQTASLRGRLRRRLQSIFEQNENRELFGGDKRLVRRRGVRS